MLCLNLISIFFGVETGQKSKLTPARPYEITNFAYFSDFWSKSDYLGFFVPTNVQQ